tara:strand:+ start:298 stop:630 length:333 start_codon:yes stop_codon:yes gene_type:complete
MRYIYINTKEDKVVLISREKVENHPDTEYMINDDFDLTKELDDTENPGKKIKMEGFLTATEFLERYNADYAQKRVNEYPSTEDQLDKIFHEGVDAWKKQIQAIKDKHPKD